MRIALTTTGSLRERRGFVLLVVMVVIVLLTLATYQYSEMMSAEAKAAASYTRSRKAKAFADSGVNYISVVLSDPAVLEEQGGNILQNPALFQNVLVEENEIQNFQGRFSIVSPLNPDLVLQGQTGFRYGVTDEAGKVNLNGLLAIDPSGDVAVNMLVSLGTPEDVAAAIVDWIDADSEPRSGGAEAASYNGLGYTPRNGPLMTLEELLYVQGVTSELLFGVDRNRNGLIDQDEGLGEGNDTLGLAAYLTVYSREQNIDSAGQPRTYINDTNTQELMGKLEEAFVDVEGGEDMAKFILAFRNRRNTVQPLLDDTGEVNSAADLPESALGLGSRRRANSIASMFDLVDVVVEVPGQGDQPGTLYASPLNDPEMARALLPILFDKMTTSRDSRLPTRVNCNTASETVLGALPGIRGENGEPDLELLQAITLARPDPLSEDTPDPIYDTPAWLLTEAGMDVTKLRTLERFITTRSEVYRMQVVGYFDRGGPTQRVEVIIDTNRGRPRVVYYRDLTELGRGFDIELPTQQ